MERGRGGRAGGWEPGGGDGRVEEPAEASVPRRESQQSCCAFHFKTVQCPSITALPQAFLNLRCRVTSVPMEPGKNQGKGLAKSDSLGWPKAGRREGPLGGHLNGNKTFPALGLEREESPVLPGATALNKKGR